MSTNIDTQLKQKRQYAAKLDALSASLRAEFPTLRDSTLSVAKEKSKTVEEIALLEIQKLQQEMGAENET